MESFFQEFLSMIAVKDYLVLFLVIALGMAAGNITIKGFSFDVSAVIFVAIFLGWALNACGVPFSMPPIVENIGLILFIYTIGIQSGPSFFEAFRREGKRLISLTIIIIALAAIATLCVEYIMGIDPVISVGLLNGALTSTPGLAAAIEAASAVDGYNAADASIGYGIAYPFGVIGVVIFIKIAHKMFRINLSKEEENYRQTITSSVIPLVGQNFIVSNANIYGKTLGQLRVRFMTKANVSRVLRSDGTLVVPSPDVVLYEGDVIRAVGTPDAMERVEMLIGSTTSIEIPKSGQIEVRWYLITNKAIVGKSLLELNMMETYRATVVRIRRSGVDITPHPSTRLRYGDKVLVSSSRGNIKGVSDLMGDSMKQLTSTSFLPISLGIILGVVVGMISIPLGSMDFSLGLTGGVLLTSLLLSYKGKTGPIIWAIPSLSNSLLRQLGLLMFLTPVGLRAGSNIVQVFQMYGIELFIIGAFITLIPMVIATAIGYYVMKINFFTLMGAITGGMTSTPGLSSAESLTENGAPQVAYATVYPFALVVIIIMSQLIVLLPSFL